MLLPTAAEAAQPSTVVAFNPAAFELPESITSDEDGNIYLSMANQVKVVTPAGQVSVFATLPIPAGAFVTGLKMGPDGYLYAGSGGFAPDPSAAFVWRISPSGVVSQFAALDSFGFPNDLAFDDDGNLYVTDPFLGCIWKLDEVGDSSIWLSDALLDGNSESPALLIHEFGVDGIAFDRNQKSLYVGNLDYGRIIKIKMDHGYPEDVQVFADDPEVLAGADGIAFDTKGTLFVAVNGQDRIAAVDKHGVVSVVAQGGLLDAPSSMVFGTTHDDKKTLYISSFAINRALGTQAGTPNPALLQMDVQHRGLSLP
jgi:sugar lactone lactonase YvrE